jgi:hypothetical protein
MTELEPLDDELADLFAAERAAPTIDVPGRTAMRARLFAAVAQLPLAAAAGTLLGGGGGKALAILAITVAAGGGTVAMLTDNSVDRSSTPTARAASSDESADRSPVIASAIPVAPSTPRPAMPTAARDRQSDVGATRAVAARPRETSAPVVPARAADLATWRDVPAKTPVAADDVPAERPMVVGDVPAGTPIARDAVLADTPATIGDARAETPITADAVPAGTSIAAGDVPAGTPIAIAANISSATPAGLEVAHAAPSPSQVVLVRRAWVALSSGQPALALQLVDQDASLHPDGVLAEERAAVQIAALAKLHRRTEARAAASRFIALHPTSVHRARIERAIEETP